MSVSAPRLRPAQLALGRRALLPAWVGPAAATAAAGVLLVAALVMAPPLYVVAAALGIVAFVIAYRAPVLTLTAYLVAAVTPLLLFSTAFTSPTLPGVPGNPTAVDLVLLLMLAAAAVKSASFLWTARGFTRGPQALLALGFFLFLFLLATSAALNFDAYALRTLGQFRYAYLVLAAPLYATVFLRTTAQRRRFVIVLLGTTLGAALLLAPVIGAVKGWEIGPGSRFYPSDLSLAVLFGWVALFVLSEHQALRVPRWLVGLLLIPVAALLVADSHRSVWLAALAMGAYVLVTAKLAAHTVVRGLALLISASVVVLVGATLAGFDVVSWVLQRGSAIVAPSADPTSSWRIDLWTANIQQWLQSPWLGRGLGAYYSGNTLEGVAATTIPHSMYVQVLVTLGVIGIALFALVVVAAWLVLRRAAAGDATRGSLSRGSVGARRAPLDRALVTVGRIVLVGGLAYSLVYSTDPATYLWVGVALAAAIWDGGAPAVRRSA